MSDETKVTQEYGAEQIQVLEGLEAVRMIISASHSIWRCFS